MQGPSMRSRTTEAIVILCAVALVWGLGERARAQTDPAVDDAKNHYKKAESAIHRGDWQTASQELRQSATLAPNNALIHFDLALAYAHIGNAKSARSELQIATQLGLPTEQRQSADALRKQLETGSGPVHPPSSNKQESASRATSVSSACALLASVAKESRNEFANWRGQERHSRNTDSTHHYFASTFALPGGDCSIAQEEDGGWFACDWKADNPAIVKAQYNSLASDIKGCTLLRGAITESNPPELGLWLEDLPDFKGLRVILSGERGDDPNVNISFFPKH